MHSKTITIFEFAAMVGRYSQFVFQLSQQENFDPCFEARVKQVFDEAIVYTAYPERIIFASDTNYLQLRRPLRIDWSHTGEEECFSFQFAECAIKLTAAS